MTQPVYRIRPYAPATDEGYAVVSWAAEAARGPTLARVKHDVAFDLVAPHVRGILADPNVHRLVVCPADGDEPIVAFAVARHPVVFHVHVKAAFRGQGIMTDLLGMLGFGPGSRMICATDTRDLRGVMAKGLWDIAVRPDLLGSWGKGGR